MIRRKDLKLQIKQAIRQIRDPETNELANYFINKAPKSFWTRPSSSSGKYHPKDENLEGGLVTHTLRVFKVAQLFIEAGFIEKSMADSVLAACLLHDVLRYGFKDEEYSQEDHPSLIADYIEEKWEPCLVADLCRRHMGRWGKDKPDTQEAWAVHLADMIASRLDDIKEV